MTKKKMIEQVKTLMTTVTPSRNEKEVRQYLKALLTDKYGKDNVWIDSYGNLFAETVAGTGNGATITLSAHMDSVNNYGKVHTLIDNKGIISAKDGICGADDKAGIAIVLEVLRNIPETFDGKIKVAFFVEEEIGCVGSSRASTNESKEWIADSDLAIVVDRRGNRDIVVGNFSQAFCSTPVGKFFEEASAMQDMDWKCVEGGISDTATFAELNVNAVNLSAGYRNEHTKNEWVSVHDMYDTVKLIVQAIAILNHHVDTFGDVTEENEWIQAYSYNSYNSKWDNYGYGSKWDNYGYSTYNSSNSTNSFYEEDLAYSKSKFGAIELADIGGMLSLTQGKGKDQQEILMDAEDFEELIMQYYDSKYKVKSSEEATAVKGGKVDTSKELTEEELPF